MHVNGFIQPPCSGRCGESLAEISVSNDALKKRSFALQEATLRVLIVEDYGPMRRYIASKVQGQPELRIIAEVADGDDAVLKAEELQPDLILMDVSLPTLDGIEATRRIQKISPKSKILFVTENRSLDIAEEALRSGGLGYVLKSDAGRDLLPAIHAVLRGKRFISASLTGHLLATTSLTAAHSMHLSWLLMFISGIG
jgi:DNA-binding NarL/FixJ family response regulator